VIPSFSKGGLGRILTSQIPLNPPLEKGEEKNEAYDKAAKGTWKQK
jgi:hypothetical protein